MIPAALLAGLLAGLVINAWWPVLPIAALWVVAVTPLETSDPAVWGLLLLEAAANVVVGVAAGRGARFLVTGGRRV